MPWEPQSECEPCRAGKIPQRMLDAPNNKLFVLIGALEAAAQVISMISVSKLPGVVLPLLQQTILLWQVALGYLIQGQRYLPVQVYPWLYLLCLKAHGTQV